MSDKFCLNFALDENDEITIEIGDLNNLKAHDVEKICVLLYSVNTGMFYYDILKQLGLMLLQAPESSGPILKLVNTLKRMGEKKSNLPLIRPSEVFGRMAGG